MPSKKGVKTFTVFALGLCIGIAGTRLMLVDYEPHRTTRNRNPAENRGAERTAEEGAAGAGEKLRVSNTGGQGVAVGSFCRENQAVCGPQHGAGLPVLHALGGWAQCVCSAFGERIRGGAAVERSAGIAAGVCERTRLAIPHRLARRW